MSGIGLWHIDSDAPKRLYAGTLSSERSLEEWIERNPSLLEQGLTIIARQLRTEAGPLDLLAVDPLGRFVLIEIKRDRLRRDALAQAIDYASCLERMDTETLRNHCDAYLGAKRLSTFDEIMQDCGHAATDQEERELLVYLVGTSIDSGLDRMLAFLTNKTNVAFRVLTFSVFESENGDVLLAREIHETETPADSTPIQSRKTPSLETLQHQADSCGVGEAFSKLTRAGLDAGFHPRTYKTSVMFAPQTHRNRCLFTVWTTKRPTPGVVRIYVVDEAIEEYIGIDRETVKEQLGSEWVDLDPSEAERFALRLKDLLDKTHRGDRPPKM
jgi:Holliday junction resolvase-like predicted endonuclease